MKIIHIELSNLAVSSANVHKHGGSDVSDRLPGIRGIGVIQSLRVNPNHDGYEVIACGRRLWAVQLACSGRPGFLVDTMCAFRGMYGTGL